MDRLVFLNGKGILEGPPVVTEGWGGVCFLSLCLGSVWERGKQEGVGSCLGREMWSGSKVFLPKPGLEEDQEGPEPHSSPWLSKAS